VFEVDRAEKASRCPVKAASVPPKGGLRVTFQKPKAVARRCAPGAAPRSCCTRSCCNGERHRCALAHSDRGHLLLLLAGVPVGSVLRLGPERGLALGHADPRRSRGRAQQADLAMQQRTSLQASVSENSQSASGRTGHPPIKGCAAIPGKLQSGLECRWIDRPGTQFTRRIRWAGLPRGDSAETLQCATFGA